MKVTILGCGGAGGVPLIGNEWGACDPADPRNNRTRVSVLIEEGGQTLLVDTSPDMREQLLRANVRDISAIFYTHAHADHTHGIDNIRSLNWLTGRSMPVFGDAQTLTELRRMFPYIFDQPPATNRFARPSVVAQEIDPMMQFETIKIQTFMQRHGEIQTVGYRFNDFAYSTDVSDLCDEAFETLQGVKVWVVGAIRERPHPTHAHVDRALEWIARVAPERAYLTHMDNSLDYATLSARLPAGVEPAYDGLIFEC